MSIIVLCLISVISVVVVWSVYRDKMENRKVANNRNYIRPMEKVKYKLSITPI